MRKNHIYNEDCRETLKRMLGEFINGVVTSPPYWGLRDYGLEPVIWDGDENCNHEWGKLIIKKMSGGNNGIAPEYNKNRHYHNQNCFCQKCNAWKGQLGLEPDFNLYIKHLCDIFDEIKRVLKKDGAIWVNIGDSYNGSGGCGSREYHKAKHTQFNKPDRNPNKYQPPKNIKFLPSKSLCNIPARFSIEMQNRGWILRNDIIWNKPNPMPESVKDRCTRSHEYIFLLTKSKKYYFNQLLESYENIINRWGGNFKRSPIREKIDENGFANANSLARLGRDMRPNKNGKNKRDVWTINTQPYPEAHFAVFPEKLIIPCIKTMPEDAIVYDPFMGSGTTAAVAYKLGRKFIGSEPNPEYCKLAEKRLKSILNQGQLF